MKNRNDSDNDSDGDDDNIRSDDESDLMRKAREVNRNRKRNYDKLIAEKEKKHLLYLKRQINKGPKKPKMLSFEVC